MSDQYDPSSSRITEERMQEWRETQLSGNVDEIPYVGEATVPALSSNGMGTTWQVLGKFFSYFDEDHNMLAAANRLKAALADAGTPGAHRDSVVTAVAEKVYDGERYPLALVPNVSQRKSLT